MSDEGKPGESFAAPARDCDAEEGQLHAWGAVGNSARSVGARRRAAVNAGMTTSG